MPIFTRYYANGSFQKQIASSYRLSNNHCGLIIEQVSKAIIKEFQTELIEINQANWISMSNEFNFKWQLPNCLGAIDGKHIPIRKPHGAGSQFFNYKRFHSIILMATVDASYKFISIDVGGAGSEGDANVFRRTYLGEMIIRDDIELNLPSDAPIRNYNMSFYFVADDAFPLSKRLIKPYTPTRSNRRLSDEEVICNYRISRARRCVENAFGILSAKWRCIDRTFHSQPDKVKQIVSACCLLHNFMLNRTPEKYIPDRFKDFINENGVTQGIWRRNSLSGIHVDYHANLRSEEAKNVRNNLKKIVNTVGRLSYQNRAARLSI